MRKRTMQTVALSFVSILVAAVLVGYIFKEQLTIIVLNQRDLTTFKVEGENMYLAGDFNSRTPKKIKSAILDNPQVTRLVLTQMPGSLDDEALYPFADWVRQKGLNTHLQSTSVISSGAVDLFLAGNTRTMEKGARIGVHSWASDTKQASDYSRQHHVHRMYTEFTVRMLGSEDFYWFTIYAAPADDLYWMTEAEIEKYKLLTPIPTASEARPAGG